MMGRVKKFIAASVPRRPFTPRGFVCAALALCLLYAVCDLLGWREYTAFLSGTAPSVERSKLCLALGIVYAAVYFGFVLVAPVLLLAAGIFALLLRPWRRRWYCLGAVILIGCVAGLVYGSRSALDPFAPPTAQAQPVDADARGRQLVPGTWEDHYQGKRTMTLNEDGTGTMVVELSGLQALLSASRLTFHMQWSLEGGRLKKQTISGEPQAQVKMILKMMGDRVDEPILELTEDRLRLLDKDGKTEYDWKRVKD